MNEESHRTISQGEPDFSEVEFTVIAITHEAHGEIRERKHLINQTVAKSPSEAIRDSLKMDSRWLTEEQKKARSQAVEYEVISHYSKATISKEDIDYTTEG